MIDEIKWYLYWKLRKFMAWMYPCTYCNGKGWNPSENPWSDDPISDCDMCVCSGIDLVG